MSPTRKLGAVLGHARARTILEAESAAKRLAHAYLFVGPVGCGRGTLARALFMAQVCETGGEEPCGTCGPCRRALAWQHEDLIVLAPPTGQASAQIKAEEVREAIRRLSFAPQGPLRLVLIRQAEHMNLTSANVLLKTLEEPPSNNILVLTVQDAGEILPTLVSRCRRMNLSPLPETLVTEELERRGVEQGSGDQQIAAQFRITARQIKGQFTNADGMLKQSMHIGVVGALGRRGAVKVVAKLLVIKKGLQQALEAAVLYRAQQLVQPLAQLIRVHRTFLHELASIGLGLGFQVIYDDLHAPAVGVHPPADPHRLAHAQRLQQLFGPIPEPGGHLAVSI